MKASLYKVYYSKKSEGSSWRNNGMYSVVTTGLIRAAQMCEEANPGCTVFNVVHCGTADYIDPELEMKSPR